VELGEPLQRVLREVTSEHFLTQGLGAFMTFAGSSRDVLLVVSPQGTMRAMSSSAHGLLGRLSETHAGVNISELVHPDDAETADDLIHRTSDLFGKSPSRQLRFRHVDGRHIWFEVLARHVVQHDVVVLSARVISESRLTRNQYEFEHPEFRGIAEAAPISILSYNEAGNCDYVNPQWTVFTGQPYSDALGFGSFERIDDTERSRVLAEVAGRPSGSTEANFLHIDGTKRAALVRWNRVPRQGLGREVLNNFDGYRDVLPTSAGPSLPDGVIVTVEDMTDRKALEQRLSHQVRHDALTGLPNRVVLRERLMELLSTSRSTQVAVLFCDLDRFKLVNDSLGHGSGDRLLVAVAQRLSRTFGDSVCLARFGGDEFVMLAEVADSRAATELSIAVTKIFQSPFDLGIGRPYACTSSVGLAVAGPGATAESLLRDADSAMYLAKERGRGRAEAFDDRIRKQALNRLALEADLHRAIEEEEFFLEYQPIVNAHTIEMLSLEALLRWDHPVRGRLGPDQFIDIAEEAGLMPRITDWVIQRACLDVKDKYEVSLNVNLSARQMMDDALPGRLAMMLTHVGFDPARFVVEITESSLISDVERTFETLKALRALGIRIAIDDFGTGFSSLSYLSKFPVDSLKIDRSFVSGLGIDPGAEEIVQAVIALAHAIGVTATAEGVETHEQRRLLVAKGCDSMQGYLFSHPVPITDLLLAR
jgi:diguanylate cyclase (GGDEF)-like protein/PAS domain S-box-containing protein